MESHKIPWFQTTNQMNYDSPTRHTLIGDRQPKAPLQDFPKKSSISSNKSPEVL
jgi:hypothetical protein